jgi:hypothetical protein
MAFVQALQQPLEKNSRMLNELRIANRRIHHAWEAKR